MIDLPSLFQHSIKDLQSQRQAEIESLAQRINLKVGQTTTALIERITPVNQQLAERISQLQVSHQLGIKPLPAELLAQPQVKLLELNIQGQALLTLSDQPVKQGQTIQLQLKTAAQLVLLPAHENSQKSSQTSSSAAALNALSQTYRQALPRQAPLQQTFRILEALQRLPELQQQLPATLKQSLNQLQQQMRTPQQLSSPEGVKTALQQSGVQLESRLKQQLPVTSQTHAAKAAVAPQISSSAPASPPPLSAQDTKAALLQLEQRLGHLLNQTATIKPSQQPLTLPVNAPVDTLVTLLKSLLANSTTSAPKTSEPNQREAILQSLQQQLQTAVAKMQTQQLHTLSQQMAKPDQPQAQHWLIEVPVRLNNDVSSVEVRIDEDWVTPREEEGDEENKERVRLWTVMLAFDLPNQGQLFAQLKIIQDSVSANLWAEQTTTLAEAKRNLKTLRQRLDADGVNVTSIECFQGRPPQQDIRLDYALVDIKT